MSSITSVVTQLRDQSRSADELHERSRRLLVQAARAGASAGLTQRQIAEAIGRSQPEVSRLLRFHGTTPLARALERNRAAILKATAAAGVRNVRVFGSVSRGQDRPGSDIDLLVDLPDHITLIGLSRLELEISKIVGADVDLVPGASLRPNIRDNVLAEAVPL
jgi:predicted nucleotidyltransferase/predicted XRE-type DNA-binding protein